MDKVNTSVLVVGLAIGVWALASQGLKFRQAKRVHKITVEIDGKPFTLDADNPVDAAKIIQLARDNASEQVVNETAKTTEQPEAPPAKGAMPGAHDKPQPGRE
jgi:hypothetical protein